MNFLKNRTVIGVDVYKRQAWNTASVASDASIVFIRAEKKIAIFPLEVPVFASGLWRAVYRFRSCWRY